MSLIIQPTRRGFILGLTSTLIAAPSIVRASSIMPIRSWKSDEQARPLNHIGWEYTMHGVDEFGNAMIEKFIAGEINGGKAMRHFRMVKGFKRGGHMVCTPLFDNNYADAPNPEMRGHIGGLLGPREEIGSGDFQVWESNPPQGLSGLDLHVAEAEKDRSIDWSRTFPLNAPYTASSY